MTLEAHQNYLPGFDIAPAREVTPRDFLYGLTIRQPWAQLIIEGERTIEQRGWSTEVRGFIVVHTGLAIDRLACEHFGLYPKVTGAILGVVELYAVENIRSEERWEDLRPQHLETGPRGYGDSTFALFLRDAIKFKRPIPYPGKLKLFKVPLSILKPEFISLGIQLT